MNAKQLIEAARNLQTLANYKGSQFAAEMADVSQHILATVRPDDDELIDWQWAVDINGHDTTNLTRYVNVTRRGEVELTNRKADGSEWEVWSSEHQLGTCKTKGQFRALCRGLGIELKEATNKESGNE